MPDEEALCVSVWERWGGGTAWFVCPELRLGGGTGPSSWNSPQSAALRARVGRSASHLCFLCHQVSSSLRGCRRQTVSGKAAPEEGTHDHPSLFTWAVSDTKRFQYDANLAGIVSGIVSFPSHAVSVSDGIPHEERVSLGLSLECFRRYCVFERLWQALVAMCTQCSLRSHSVPTTHLRF